MKFEWRGDWDKYINGGMQKAAEIGLCVVVSGTLQGDDHPTENITYLAPQTVRNSPLWKTDPKQQLAYLGIKKWARLYCPDVIMGVYTVDEVEEFAGEKTVNPAPYQPETLTLDQMLGKVKAMSEAELTPGQLAGLDLKPFGKEDILTIKGAITARRKELKASAVVADIKPEPPKPDDTDWRQMIDNSQSQEELTAIYNSMPPDAQQLHNDAVDEQADFLRGLVNA